MNPKQSLDFYSSSRESSKLLPKSSGCILLKHGLAKYLATENTAPTAIKSTAAGRVGAGFVSNHWFYSQNPFCSCTEYCFSINIELLLTKKCKRSVLKKTHLTVQIYVEAHSLQFLPLDRNWSHV